MSRVQTIGGLTSAALAFALAVGAICYGLGKHKPDTEIKNRTDSNGYYYVRIHHPNEPDTIGVYDKKGDLVGAYANDEAFGVELTLLNTEDDAVRKRLEWAEWRVGNRYKDGKLVE